MAGASINYSLPGKRLPVVIERGSEGERE